MTYFEDLSDYSHFSRYYRPQTKNIGWFEKSYDFRKEAPSEETLNLLWTFCSVSVVQTGGGHFCEFCQSPKSVNAVRNGSRLRLITSEIRVFSNSGIVDAAPTLIYHYVRTHHYKPPDEFLSALNESPRPPAPEYFDRLRELGIEWNPTYSPPSHDTGFKFVKVDGKVERVEVPDQIHWDED